MSHTLTRRNVSAIAKLDFADLSHAQRIDAIATALGYETAAALMATLKNAEGELTTPVEEPVRALILFGETLVGCVYENEPILDEDGDIVDGEIKEITFASRAELKAYSQGMADADGWMGHLVEADTEEHPFFQARIAKPSLSFEDWYTANQPEMKAEDKKSRANK